MSEFVAESQNSDAPNDETISYDHIPWPVRPSLGINYDFIVSMYLGGCGLALFFFTLEKQLLDPLIERDDDHIIDENNNAGGDDIEKEIDPWKEFAKGMQGMYYVFAPFLLCLPWSLMVRHFWVREIRNNVSKGKKDD